MWRLVYGTTLFLFNLLSLLLFENGSVHVFTADHLGFDNLPGDLFLEKTDAPALGNHCLWLFI